MTNQNISEMTKAEINLEIARLAYPKHAGRWFIRRDGSVWNAIEGKGFDFRDWGDLMPLIVKYLINISFCDDGICIANETSFERHPFELQSENKDPQRASAECLLKVLRAKAGENEDDE